jgi:hypothetical protein
VISDERYKIHDMADLHDEPPIEWLVKDWIAAKEFSVFWGDPGVYKSFVVQGLSLQIASQEAKVIYVAAEGSTGLAARVHAWNALHHSDPYRNDDNWKYMSAPVDFSGHENVWMNWSNDINEAFDDSPDLVVLDTLARCNLSGDENSAKDMGHFVENVERFRRDNETAIWVIHHANVSSDNKRERGSSVLRAAAFGMYRVYDPRVKNDGASVVVDCDKMKDGEQPSPVRVDLRRVSLDIQEHGEVFKSSLALRQFPGRPAEAPSSKEEGENHLLDEIRSLGGSVTGKQLHDKGHFKTVKQANRALYRLTQAGKLLKYPETGRYEVVDNE